MGEFQGNTFDQLLSECNEALQSKWCDHRSVCLYAISAFDIYLTSKTKSLESKYFKIQDRLNSVTDSLIKKLRVNTKPAMEKGNQAFQRQAEINEEPRMESNEVKIDEDFYLGKYPVTQQQWKSVMGNNPSYFKGESLPVEKVSHDDVQAFIQKLNTLCGKQHYRLPTEEEWEYACRSGSTLAYFFGDSARQLGEYAWYGLNSGKITHPVGKKMPNEWGVYDMTGNVWEWTGVGMIVVV